MTALQINLKTINIYESTTCSFTRALLFDSFTSVTDDQLRTTPSDSMITFLILTSNINQHEKCSISEKRVVVVCSKTMLSVLFSFLIPFLFSPSSVKLPKIQLIGYVSSL